MTVIVVFSDALNRTLRDEDYIAYSKHEAKQHRAELRKEGHEPVTRTFDDEAAFYSWKEQR